MQTIRKLISSLLLVAIVVISVIFSLIEPKFFTASNLITILSQSATMGILSLGLTFVLCVGEMDFAAGAEYTIGACCISLLLSSGLIQNYWIALAITMVFMVLVGALNAYLHTVIGIPSFIATLGVSTFATGYLKFITNSTPLFSLRWPEQYTLLGQSYVLGSRVPLTAVLLLGFVAFSIYLTERTAIGRKIYAVGGNPVAAANVGINIVGTKFAAFILCAAFCGFAGIIRASMLNQANAQMGDSMLMQGMSCVMLGATFYRLGVFNAVGTITATILISIINNGLTMTNASTWVKDYVLAFVLLAAVALISYMRLKLVSRDH